MRIERIAVVLFALTAFPCWAATEVDLPPPTAWEAPLGAPSAPLDLTLATPWTRGANSVTVQPSGTNDLTAIQNAIDAMSAPWIQAAIGVGSTLMIMNKVLHLVFAACAASAVAAAPEIAHLFPNYPGISPQLITGEHFDPARTEVWFWEPPSGERNVRETADAGFK